MALAIRTPTLLTISASLLEELFTTLFSDKKDWYCDNASCCKVASENKANWLRPVIELVVQATKKDTAVNRIIIFFIFIVFDLTCLNNYI